MNRLNNVDQNNLMRMVLLFLYIACHLFSKKLWLRASLFLERRRKKDREQFFLFCSFFIIIQCNILTHLKDIYWQRERDGSPVFRSLTIECHQEILLRNQWLCFELKEEEEEVC